MNPPEKTLTDAQIDEIYGLEPAIDSETVKKDADVNPAFVVVDCPYCGEAFETSADASAGPCTYVEDCQVCCQPIEMELKVDENGDFAELVTRRGDGE